MNNRMKNIENTITNAILYYNDTGNISYVFDPETGNISSNLNKFGPWLCLYANCVPWFIKDKYVGYILNDTMYYIKDKKIIKTENANNFFIKFINNRLPKL